MVWGRVSNVQAVLEPERQVTKPDRFADSPPPKLYFNLLMAFRIKGQLFDEPLGLKHK